MRSAHDTAPTFTRARLRRLAVAAGAVIGSSLYTFAVWLAGAR